MLPAAPALAPNGLALAVLRLLSAVAVIQASLLAQVNVLGLTPPAPSSALKGLWQGFRK